MILLSLLIGLLVSPASAAESLDTNACVIQMEQTMGKEQRLYRSTLLGQKTTEESDVGAVRYDKDGKAWQKTDKDSWKRFPDEGKEGSEKRSNSDMEDAAEFSAHRGWLEVKKASTSELLPAVLQSYRALRCHVEQVCSLASKSISAKKDAELTIDTVGCEPVKMKVLSSCTKEAAPNAATASFVTMVNQCGSMRDALLAREKELTKFIIAYDSAQRSLYQLLGFTDSFLSQMQTTLLSSVWRAVQAFQILGQIPCFSSQCER